MALAHSCMTSKNCSTSPMCSDPAVVFTTTSNKWFFSGSSRPSTKIVWITKPALAHKGMHDSNYLSGEVVFDSYKFNVLEVITKKGTPSMNMKLAARQTNLFFSSTVLGISTYVVFITFGLSGVVLPLIPGRSGPNILLALEMSLSVMGQ